MLLLLTVLAVACLGLLAAPALANYPVSGMPHTAYLHVWWGSEPIYWLECDGTGPDANWDGHSASAPMDPENQWPYKAIPADYRVVVSAVWAGWPKAQIKLIPFTQALTCTMNGPTGRQIWWMTPRRARCYWGPVEYGWDSSTIYQESTQIWVTSWTCDLGRLRPGTYTGHAKWVVRVPYLDFETPSEDDPNAPTVYPAGTVLADADYSFTVAAPGP
jgi:hypothetical protein